MSHWLPQLIPLRGNIKVKCTYCFVSLTYTDRYKLCLVVTERQAVRDYMFPINFRCLCSSVILVELDNLTRNKPDQSFNLHWHFNSQFKWVKHNLDAWNVLLRALVPFSPRHYIYSAPQLPVCNGCSTANSSHVEMHSAKHSNGKTH